MLIGNLTITDTSVFEKAALDFATKNIKFTGTISDDVKFQIGVLILKALMDSPTTQELLSGKLRDDLGLFGNLVNSTIEAIAKHITDGMEIEAPKKGKKLPTIKLKFMAQDVNKIIKVPGASFQSKGGSVDWLEWLLTRGTQIIISDYWIFSEAEGKTRSGGKKVMQKISKTPRDPFRIDPKHAGTVKDNFVTRALDSIKDDISTLVMSSMMGTN